MERYSMDMFKVFQPKQEFLTHFDDAFPPISSKMSTDRLEKLFIQWDPTRKLIVPILNKAYIL